MDSGWGTVGGGAGGSYNVGTSQSNTAGYQSGNGSVIITVLYGVSISQTSTIACNVFFIFFYFFISSQN